MPISHIMGHHQTIMPHLKMAIFYSQVDRDSIYYTFCDFKYFIKCISHIDSYFGNIRHKGESYRLGKNTSEMSGYLGYTTNRITFQATSHKKVKIVKLICFIDGS